MFARSARWLFLPVVLACLGTSSAAQVTPVPLPTQGTTPPPPAQAQQMLQNNPGLVARLQQMMQSSGLTPEQIRARLKAQGYPDSLLDQYLPGGTRPDSTYVPNEDVFSAIRAIGVGDSLFVDSLSSRARSYRRRNAGNDSAFFDTLRTALKNDTIASAVRTLLKSRELQRQTMDSGFTVFGVDLFVKESSQFDANMTAGADANYRFGPGDKLGLYLTGDVEKSYPLTVNSQGIRVHSRRRRRQRRRPDALATRGHAVYADLVGCTPVFAVAPARRRASISTWVRWERTRCT